MRMSNGSGSRSRRRRSRDKSGSAERESRVSRPMRAQSQSTSPVAQVGSAVVVTNRLPADGKGRSSTRAGLWV
eukprot:10302488-Prorocentrum_lima.AAC.1